jgi:putative acetyltransferase
MIREAREDEAEALMAIQREAALAAFGHIFPPDLYPYPSDEFLGIWREALADPETDVFVAEEDEAPVGSVSVSGEFLSTLYVLPSHQSRGVGTALHDFALERLRGRGARRAKLWTLEENWPARRFYERRGWSLTDAVRTVPFPPNPIDVQYEISLG